MNENMAKSIGTAMTHIFACATCIKYKISDFKDIETFEKYCVDHIDAVVESFKGNRAIFANFSNDDAQILFEATLRRAQEILDGRWPV